MNGKVLPNRILVIGLGKTGRSVAKFLSARGVKLVLTDVRTDVEVVSLPKDAELILGVERPEIVDNVEMVIPSPGVPRNNVMLKRALELGIPVIGEIELASWFIKSPMIAVTGTNGKSTVTTMIAEILKGNGANVFAGGNLGTPLIDAVDGDYELLVVEISSFQLEWTNHFRPHVGVYLNLSEDHCDRYRDLIEYGQFKARLFANQQQTDWAVLNYDDRHVWPLASSLRSTVCAFGLEKPPHQHATWIDGRLIRFSIQGDSGAINLEGFKLPGVHNLSNAMAASTAALLSGVPPETIERALKQYRGLPHRLEFVREVNGVAYINDSKSTNVDGARAALLSVKPPVIWIAGGLDKGGDYRCLEKVLRERVKVAVLMGQARERMRRELTGLVPLEVVPTLADAVMRAAKLAERGDTVLLSPACSSFDQFKDYAERGRVFKKLVMEL